MMKHPWLRFISSSVLIIALSACGGGSGGTPVDEGGGDASGGGDDGGGGGDGVGEPVSRFTSPTESQALYFALEMPTEFDAVRANHSTGGFTLLSDLPGSGVVSYDGFMEINIASTPAAAIQSAATLTVDLQSGAMGGGASTFMGWAYNVETDRTELALYEGNIVFSGGSLNAGTGGDTRLTIEVDGALNNGLQDFSLTGTLDGRMYGAEGEGIYAGGSYYGLGRDITLTADGVDVYGDANLWAVKIGQP